MLSSRLQTAAPAQTPARGLLTVVFLLGIYAATLLWMTGGFAARAEGLARWSFVLALLTNAGLIPLVARRMGVPLRRAAEAFGLSLLVYGGCCLLAGLLYDTSFDGQTYHSQGILALAQGWNPVYDTLPMAVPNNNWVQYYSKGYEYVAYALYAVTGNLEWSKGLNGVLLVAAALAVHHATAPYLAGIGVWKRRALVAVAVLNPVTVLTFFTFYVDGQLTSGMLLVLAAFEIFRRSPRVGGWLLFCGLLILSQLKFTALVYCVLLAAGGAAFLVLTNRRRVVAYAAVCLVAGAVAVGWVGYNPYVRNFSEKGHPFYPLMGRGSIAIWKGNLPPSFEHKNRFQKLAESSFARSRNVHGALVLPEPVLKVPFTFALKEWTVFKSPDVRIGGFGPLWSGALVLGILVLALDVRALRRQHAAVAVFAWGGLLLLLMTLVIPESWNSRYVPQLWWLPLWGAAFGLRSGPVLVRRLSTGLLWVLGINLAGMAAVSVGANALVTTEIRRQLGWLQQQTGPLEVPPNFFYANNARFDRAGLAWRPFPADTAQLAASHRALTIQNSQTRVFYQGAPYQPGALFSRLVKAAEAGH